MERYLQKKRDTLFHEKEETFSPGETLSGPHRLIGAEIWAGEEGKEEVFLEGVAGIEFHDGKIVLQILSGKRFFLRIESTRVIVREKGFVLRAANQND